MNHSRQKLKYFLVAIGGIGGLIALVGVLIALVQVLQSELASRSQNTIDATVIAIQQDQLGVLKSIATLQSIDANSEPTATYIAIQLLALEATSAALQSTQQALPTKGYIPPVSSSTPKSVMTPPLPQPESIVTPSSEAGEVIKLVNSERAQVGCSPLQISSQLTAVAQKHSEEMALNDYFGSTSLDGRSARDRIGAVGYESAAENIAAGYPTSASVMAGWMASQGHRANILNCDLEEIGVGYYYLANDAGDVNYNHYWIQSFGTRK